MSDVGEITAVVADTVAAQKALAFDPTILTDGIELSDDELPRCVPRSTVFQRCTASATPQIGRILGW
jgi:hypothetical protein